MSFERDTRSSRKITPSKLFNIHTSPSIHPIVVSPLNASQLKTKSSENPVP